MLKPYECPQDCPERRQGCHGACERYAEYARIRQEILKAKAAERDADCAYYDSKKHIASERSYRELTKRGFHFK